MLLYILWPLLCKILSDVSFVKLVKTTLSHRVQDFCILILLALSQSSQIQLYKISIASCISIDSWCWALPVICTCRHIMYKIQLQYLQVSPREVSWQDVVMRLPVEGAVVGVGTTMYTSIEQLPYPNLVLARTCGEWLITNF